MIWCKVCFMQTEKRLRSSISSFTLWMLLRHQRWTSGMCQIPCPTRVPQGPAALRCHLEKYKSFSIGKGKEFSAILLPPDRETDLLISTIPAPVKPNLLWKSPKSHFPGDAGKSSTKQEWHWSGPQLAVLPFGRFTTKAPCRSTFPTWVVPRHSDSSAPRLQIQTSLHGQSGRYVVSRKMSVWPLKK